MLLEATEAARTHVCQDRRSHHPATDGPRPRGRRRRRAVEGPLEGELLPPDKKRHSATRYASVEKVLAAIPKLMMRARWVAVHLRRSSHVGLPSCVASSQPRVITHSFFIIFRLSCIGGRARTNEPRRVSATSSGKGHCPFLLQRPLAKSTVGSTQHELPLANAMGELDPRDRHCGIGE
jgi:hypothetical protein